MGVKTYAAIFRNGRISGGITATHFDKTDGISGLVNDAIASYGSTSAATNW